MQAGGAWRALILLLFVPLFFIDRAAGPHVDVGFGYFVLIVFATIEFGLGGAVTSVGLALVTGVWAKSPWVGGVLPAPGFALSYVLRFAAFATVATLVYTVTAERRQIERLSLTDKLTGLFNRRRFDEALAEEALRAERYHHPLALLMLDVDHFKRFNDRHGHPKGDAVLRQVGKVILRGKRSTDLAFRYGGEEFCLLLPETGIAEARDVAERIRVAIERESFIGEHTQPGARLTVSLGVAALLSAEDPRRLVSEADQALYGAKEKGRNRVEVAEAPGHRRDPLALRRA
jgi:diguanylate cyclase (GGDEF)-like protein